MSIILFVLIICVIFSVIEYILVCKELEPNQIVLLQENHSTYADLGRLKNPRKFKVFSKFSLTKYGKTSINSIVVVLST